MSNLKDLYISDSYTGLLHTASTSLTGGKAQVFDGAGNESALLVGSQGSGITVDGQLTAGGFQYPVSDITNGVAVSDGNFNITLQSLQSLLKMSGSDIANGVYQNPNITFTDGVITAVHPKTPAIVLSSDPTEIVVTKYIEGNTYVSDVKIGHELWAAALLPNHIPTKAKAIIGYIRAFNNGDRRWAEVKCSNDNGETMTPVFFVAAGEDAKGGRDLFGSGCQFQMFTNGSRGVWFKDFGNSYRTNDYEFHIIAYQY
jgi:hypothetical protein